MDEKTRRKIQRRDIGRPSWALLLYYIFLNYVVMAVMEIQMFRQGFLAVIESDSWMSFPDGVANAASALMENGWGYLIACAVVVSVIPMWKGKTFFREMFVTKQAMTGKAFVQIACIFFGGQFLFQVIAILEELFFNLFDMSVMSSMESASAGADSISMFLYMGLGAPVVEEIVFRGFIMRSLEHQGKRFAIVASAILFGLFHGNFVQSPYAFAVGLVLGYVTMEYSIGWAMVLHMLNNLVLGDSLMRLTSFLPEEMGILIQWSIFIGSAIAASVILIRKRKEVRLWMLQHPPTKGGMRAFFTAPANIILMIIMVGNAVVMLFL